MANHVSAIKRHRQSRKKRAANQSAKARIRTLGRRVEAAILAGDPAEAARELQEASSAFARAASKGLVHSRAASRRTSRLAKKVAKLTRS